MSADLRRTSLKKDTILETIEHGEGYERLKFKIALPDRVIAYSVTGVDISYDVTLYHDSNKIYMNCRVFWDTINHRLRIAMPLTITGQDVYEIPYGWLERKEYGLTRFREGSENWAGSINDYPAMNWAGVQAEQCGVSLQSGNAVSLHYEQSERRADDFCYAAQKPQQCDISPRSRRLQHDGLGRHAGCWNTRILLYA